ncbi:MAG: hypothetical protein R3C16_07050 [Hyphomonadaceae bacterium]
MRALLALALATLCCGCATLQGFQTELTSIPTAEGVVSVHTSPADNRAILVIQSAPRVVETTTTGADGSMTVTRTSYPSQTVVCPQPPGDVAYSRTAETLLKLGVDAPASGTDVDLEGTLRAAAAAMELEGRTQSVLLARDMLSFTCVQSATGVQDQVAQANFNRIANMLENLAEADRQRASAAVARAVADVAEARVDTEVVQEIVTMRRSLRENRTNAIVTNLSLQNGSLNTAKRDQAAGVAAVQQALSGQELAEFRQLRNIPDLRGFLIDLELNALSVLETATKP